MRSPRRSPPCTPGGVPGADEGARDVEPRVVGQLEGVAQDTARLRDRPLPERLELLLAEPVEVLLRRELIPRQRLLRTIEVGSERRDARGGVDVHHRRDPLGDSVARDVAGEAGPAVHGEHDGTICRLDRLADRVDVVGQADRGPIGIGRPETGQRERGDVVAIGAQEVGDLVPRPRPEPEPGNQDDRWSRHASTLGAGTDIRPSSCHAASCRT